MTLQEDLRRRARDLEWLLFDVDGVLTDGRMLYTAEGEELKLFHVHDGLGFRLAQRAGLKLGLLSGRRSAPLEFRASELDFDAVILGRSDKADAFAGFLRDHRTTPERVAYIGDDLLDLCVLERCALSFAPPNAVAEVRRRVDHVLATGGGEGAAREMIETILEARGVWDEMLERFDARRG